MLEKNNNSFGDFSAKVHHPPPPFKLKLFIYLLHDTPLWVKQSSNTIKTTYKTSKRNAEESLYQRGMKNER